MKEKEICFIICTNNKMYADECIYYINHLYIPDGYTIDILTVEDAKSMTAGYNEAMNYSTAKYKVYLHQDTFIINTDFIQDILNIFRSNNQIGMIGVIGTPRLPENGIMWDAKRYGMIYEQHIYETVMLSNQCEKSLEEVQAIDGLMMVTQYDIPWRSDLFAKWDFYDCSQSLEFIKKGYKIVIPKMQRPWCVHDCGFLNLSDYETEREKFVQEYLFADK
ncbi:MAG: glycosyltransferase family protein [Lachnospiraceae bacterium]